MAESLSERFWSKCTVDPASGCWNWTRSTFKTGYGKFNLRAKATRYAHRLAYELHYGVAPGKAFVCHRCDNRLCINPEHLFLGDVLANNRDMAAKGRNPRGDDHWTRRPGMSARISVALKQRFAANPSLVLRGSRRAQAKLTEHDIPVIRTLYAWGMPQTTIARVFGVTRSNIGLITRRINWSHV